MKNSMHLSRLIFYTHKNSYKPEGGLQKLCSSSLPNLTCITFRVFGSLECDWERKTMHWSSLDSVLLSALQRKVAGERSRPKKNQSHIHQPQWVSKKKKKKQKGGAPLSGCHAPTSQAALFLFGSGICGATEHVQREGQSNPEVRCSSSNLWVWGQMRTINDNIKVGWRGRQNQSIGLTHTEGKKRAWQHTTTSAAADMRGVNGTREGKK